MWGRIDNQEVGLEAATLQRVRNSSLVKWFRADNVAGLKHSAEAAGFTVWLGRSWATRAVQAGGPVGERSRAGEAAGEPSRGCAGSGKGGLGNGKGGGE